MSAEYNVAAREANTVPHIFQYSAVTPSITDDKVGHHRVSRIMPDLTSLPGC